MWRPWPRPWDEGEGEGGGSGGVSTGPGRGPGGFDPLAVGFGISRPEQVAALAREADGIVIGSALIQQGEACGFDREALQAFVADLRRAAVRTSASPRCAVPSWESDPET